MRRALSDELRIARPCHEDDASMTPSTSGLGRYCTACEQDVHAVAELTRAEVVSLVAAHRGRPLCLEVMVRDADGAIVVADGYVHPTHGAKRALPLLAVAASMTLAACTPSSTPHADEPVVLVPPPPAPNAGTLAPPSVLASPASPAPTSAPVSAAAPEPVESEPEPEPAPPAHASTPKPPVRPIKPIVRPQHTIMKGGRG